MTYDPRAYWTERAARQGPSYVGQGGHAAKSEREAEAFRAALRPELGGETFGHVLDFGCGSGRLSAFLAGYCGCYTGVDIARPAIEHASALGIPRARFRWLRGDRIALPDDAVDLVVATVVFQHIPPGDFEAWAAEIRRVLQPDGQALVIDNGPVAEPYPHMHPRTPEAVGEALGLAVVSVADLGGHWLARYGCAA